VRIRGGLEGAGLRGPAVPPQVRLSKAQVPLGRLRDERGGAARAQARHPCRNALPPACLAHMLSRCMAWGMHCFLWQLQCLCWCPPSTPCCREYFARYVLVVTNRAGAPTLPTPASVVRALSDWLDADAPGDGAAGAARQALAVSLFQQARNLVAQPGCSVDTELCSKLFHVALRSGVSALVADVAALVLRPAVQKVKGYNPCLGDKLLLPLLAGAWADLDVRARAAVSQLVAAVPIPGVPLVPRY
jgi:hypothetical protein